MFKEEQGIKCELVTEVAKDLTYEESPLLYDSLYVFTQQARRLARLRGKVDLVITDCPLPLTLVYRSGIYKQAWFEAMVDSIWSIDSNFNVALNRVKPYAAYGRTQTEDEAKAIDDKIWALGIPFDLDIPADDKAAQIIFEEVKLTLDNRVKA